ncbi:sugar transferase [Nocardioides mesophilus]|uniref:Sugar transferase n=2 Tax=Nocardioides mesophilus TaxID=433659 RepID=A0A7G9RGZ4_9ACTN|nr:sugar transferase [Nocardioides mesophilus]
MRVAIDIWFVDPGGPATPFLSAGPWIVLTWLAILAAEGGYAVRLFGTGPAEFRAVSLASVITAGLVGMFCYLVGVPLSRGFVLLAFALGTPLLLLERYAVRKVLHALRMRGHLLHRVIVVGGPSGIAEVTAVLERERYVGYQVVGVCLPPGGLVEESLGLPVLGTTAEIRAACREAGADTVLVARGAYDSAGQLRRIAWHLEGSDIDLVVVPSLTDVAGPRISMRPVAGLPLLHVEQPQASEAGGLPKRVFDVTVAAVLLVLLSPLLLVVAVLVKRHDGGPVFFHQARVGRHGEPFRMLKFRSMVVDAESRLAHLHEHNEGAGVLFKMRQDPRVTPVGALLRRYSLDELPQLVNVLRGEMSLVGPRPPLQREVDAYEIDVRRRLLVRPGVTGLWQVSGRSELTWEESVRLDLYYVDNWSMTSDFVIMAKTVRAVLGSSGAY